MNQLTEAQQYVLDTIVSIEENMHTKEFRSDLRELQLAADYRAGKLSLEQVDLKLADLLEVQMKEDWAELNEEYKDDPRVIKFMDEYGYVPFSFELENE